MSLTTFSFPAEVITSIFTKVNEGSAFRTLARDIPLYSPNDAVAYRFNGKDANFHRAGDAQGKHSDDENVVDIEVLVRKLYKMLDFPDFRYDDAKARMVIEQIIAQSPGIIANTLDKASFGPNVFAGSPWVGYTEDPVEIDATAESVLAAIEAVEANGYAPNGAILDTSFKSIIRKAFTQGTTTSPLSLNVGNNGFLLGSVNVYFRELGKPVGVIGDFNQAASGVFPGVETNIFYPENDKTQRVANMVTVYTGFSAGLAIADQKAFQPVEIAAATGGEDEG